MSRVSEDVPMRMRIIYRLLAKGDTRMRGGERRAQWRFSASAESPGPKLTEAPESSGCFPPATRVQVFNVQLRCNVSPRCSAYCTHEARISFLRDRETQKMSHYSRARNPLGPSYSKSLHASTTMGVEAHRGTFPVRYLSHSLYLLLMELPVRPL